MAEKKTILVIGSGKILPFDLIEQIRKSEPDAVIISAEEAKEKGIIPTHVFEKKPEPFILKPGPEFTEPSFYDRNQAKNDCKKGWRK